jgi:cytochrome c553
MHLRFTAAWLVCGFLSTPNHAIAGSPPYWAFAVNPPASTSDTARSRSDSEPRHVPNTDLTFTNAQIADLFNVPDWHPEGHPPMPAVVAHGSAPRLFACGYCHLPNGQGRPENASLAGLPVEYMIDQVADFKDGSRKSAEPRQLPTVMMLAIAAQASESEVRTAASYFSSLHPRPWIRVVETGTVPRTHVSGWMMVSNDGHAREPIGHRIIEMPVNLEQTELRNDASGFVAYVPLGSIARGRALVASGGAGKTIQCAICHGANLRGLGTVPSIAGRSPSYIVRQLYDIQNGARAGIHAQLMKAVVARLSIDDMIAVAAYAASLNP